MPTCLGRLRLVLGRARAGAPGCPRSSGGGQLSTANGCWSRPGCPEDRPPPRRRPRSARSPRPPWRLSAGSTGPPPHPTVDADRAGRAGSTSRSTTCARLPSARRRDARAWTGWQATLHRCPGGAEVTRRRRPRRLLAGQRPGRRDAAAGVGRSPASSTGRTPSPAGCPTPTCCTGGWPPSRSSWAPPYAQALAAPERGRRRARGRCRSALPNPQLAVEHVVLLTWLGHVSGRPGPGRPQPRRPGLAGPQRQADPAAASTGPAPDDRPAPCEGRLGCRQRPTEARPPTARLRAYRPPDAADRGDRRPPLAPGASRSESCWLAAGAACSPRRCWMLSLVGADPRDMGELGLVSLFTARHRGRAGRCWSVGFLLSLYWNAPRVGARRCTWSPTSP